MSLDFTSATYSTSALLRWFWSSYVRRHSHWIGAALVFMAIQGSMLGVLSYLIGPMFDTVFLESDRSALVWLGLGVFAVFTIRGIAGFIQRWITARVGEWVKLNLRMDLMRQVLQLDYSFFSEHEPGGLLERILVDSEEVKTVWSALLAPAIRDSIALASLLFVTIRIDWFWTLIAIAGIPLLFTPVRTMQVLTGRAARVAKLTATDIMSLLDEVFHGVLVIKLFGLERDQFGKVRETCVKNQKAVVRTEVGQAGTPAMVDIAAGIGFFGMLYIAGNEVIDGDKTIGQFMSFFTAVVLIFDPLKRLGHVTTAWARVKVPMGRVRAVFDMKPMIVSPSKEMMVNPDAGEAVLKFDRVDFDFGDHVPVLSKFSAELSPRKTTALVGFSGAGKSTLINLLTRIFEVKSGNILIAGKDIRTFAVEELRGLFGVVPQEPGIFDLTVRENVMLGNPEAGQEEFDRATSAALVDQMAENLKEGLDSRCGPRGSSLSGGQRQRVALARALLRGTRILLLDESTSALDARTERRIHENLAEHYKDRTTIIVAHRLATIRNADSIIVLHKGEVAEQGTHDDLMELNGIYSSLYKLQMM